MESSVKSFQDSIGDGIGALRYERRGYGDRILVLLNMNTESVLMTIESGTILVSTDFDRVGQKVTGTVKMKGVEGNGHRFRFLNFASARAIPAAQAFRMEGL